MLVGAAPGVYGGGVTRYDALVIGGGVAGLAAAWQLARAGKKVRVLEREALPCTHSSGRNAAIFRHAEPVVELARLARRSRQLLDEVTATSDWLDVTGALYVAPRAAPIDALEDSARRAQLRVRRVEQPEILRLEPSLRSGDAAYGLYSPDDGIIDLHVVTEALSRAARLQGAELSLQSPVRRVLLADGRVAGVELESGAHVEAELVVIAAGAWAAELGAEVGAALPLVPLRRHLALLEGSAVRELSGPIVWRIVEDVYFRREGRGALASPGDEQPFEPCIPPTDPEALELLGHKLAELAPALGDVTVRRAWACLRTFAPDRNLVIGRDLRVPGLAWLAGLGGHGMTLATAAAELLREEIVDGRAPPEGFAPRRLGT